MFALLHGLLGGRRIGLEGHGLAPIEDVASQVPLGSGPSMHVNFQARCRFSSLDRAIFPIRVPRTNPQE